MTTALCIFIPDTSSVFKCVYRKVPNSGFQKEYYFVQNMPYEETEYRINYFLKRILWTTTYIGLLTYPIKYS